MAAITFNEMAQQQYAKFVDYVCLLARDDPSNYSLTLDANSQAIDHVKHGRILHDIRLKSFVGKLTCINKILEIIIMKP